MSNKAAKDAQGTDSLQQRLTFLIHTVSNRIGLFGQHLHREHGINHFTARILVLLLEFDELRISDLVELLVLPQSTLSSHLQVLQKKGLIRKRRSRKDSRSVYLSLSPTGLELAHACNDMSQKANAGMLEGIDPAECGVAIDFLRKISQRLPELLEQLGEEQTPQNSPKARTKPKLATKD